MLFLFFLGVCQGHSSHDQAFDACFWAQSPWQHMGSHQHVASRLYLFALARKVFAFLAWCWSEPDHNQTNWKMINCNVDFMHTNAIIRRGGGARFALSGINVVKQFLVSKHSKRKVEYNMIYYVYKSGWIFLQEQNEISRILIRHQLRQDSEIS